MYDNLFTTPHDILGVPKTATPDEITSAYKSLVRHWHPDRNKASNATEVLKSINEAYELVRDPVLYQKWEALQQIRQQAEENRKQGSSKEQVKEKGLSPKQIYVIERYGDEEAQRMLRDGDIAGCKRWLGKAVSEFYQGNQGNTYTHTQPTQPTQTKKTVIAQESIFDSLYVRLALVAAAIAVVIGICTGVSRSLDAHVAAATATTTGGQK